MPSGTESKESKESNETKEYKQKKAEKDAEDARLPEYEYKPLKNPDALRLIRLLPANDTQIDIVCEIVEVDIPEDGDNTANGSDATREKPKADTALLSHTDSVESTLPSLLEILEQYKTEDEERPPSRGASDHEKEDAVPEENVKVKESDKKKHHYEAVSWCWGREPADQVLRVHEGDNDTAF